MDTHRQSNGWQTFLEHYWFLTIGVSVLVTTVVLNFFSRLTGITWI